MRTMNATEFKAHCLRVLDEVSRTGEPVQVLKRGKPVAQVTPAVASDDRVPQHSLKGTVRIRGDIIGPVLPAGAWDVERR
ncbi:MAG: type II toxin-antitoxin system Phd/YefM family antitoxin [Acidimicrobiales bacterium]